MNSVGGLFKGTQNSDGRSDSILEKESHLRPIGIRESEVVCVNLYPNRYDVVNQNEILPDCNRESI